MRPAGGELRDGCSSGIESNNGLPTAVESNNRLAGDELTDRPKARELFGDCRADNVSLKEDSAYAE